MSERNEEWCKEFVGSKFNGVFDQYRGHDKYSKSSIDDDMMNNIYANCIVGFKLKAKKAKKQSYLEATICQI